MAITTLPGTVQHVPAPGTHAAGQSPPVMKPRETPTLISPPPESPDTLPEVGNAQKLGPIPNTSAPPNHSGGEALHWALAGPGAASVTTTPRKHPAHAPLPRGQIWLYPSFWVNAPQQEALGSCSASWQTGHPG